MKDFDYEIDKKFNSIKMKIDNVTLDEKVKDDIVDKLNIDMNSNSKKENKKTKILYYHKAILALCACLFVCSGITIAGQISDLVNDMFSNSYKEFEDGTKIGKVDELDMEYQEYEGVALKIDYAFYRENNLYLVFDVKTEDEIDYMAIDFLEDFIIKKNETNEVVNMLDIKTACNTKRKEKNNYLFFAKISKLGNIKDMEINVRKILLIAGKEEKVINHNWEFNLNL